MVLMLIEQSDCSTLLHCCVIAHTGKAVIRLVQGCLVSAAAFDVSSMAGLGFVDSLSAQREACFVARELSDMVPSLYTLPDRTVCHG